MSIEQKLAALENAGKIKRFTVEKSRRSHKRRLYLAGQAIIDYESPNSATNLFRLGGFIQAALTRWVMGDLVFGKKRGEFLDRLDPPPPEVWEIRVTAPTPQVRLFGRFVESDTLILTNFHTRSHLGSKGSANWIAAMGTCVSTWAGIFPNQDPHSGTVISHYVTENCHEYPI